MKNFDWFFRTSFAKIIMNMPVQQKMVLLTLVTVAGLLGIAFTGFLPLFQASNDSRALSALIDLSVPAGNLAHELQKERGLSAGFIASGGTNDLGLLDEQRQLSDERIKQVRDALANWRGKNLDKALVANIRKQLDEIPGIRVAVDKVAITLPEEVGFYTTLNRRLFRLTGSMASLSADTGTTTRLAAYNALLTAKDDMGLVRAKLNAALARGGFDRGSFESFNQSANSRDALLKQFETFASKSILAEYNKRQQSGAVTTAAELEVDSTSKYTGAKVAGDTGAWLESTSKVATGLSAVADNYLGRAYSESNLLTNVYECLDANLAEKEWALNIIQGSSPEGADAKFATADRAWETLKGNPASDELSGEIVLALETLPGLRERFSNGNASSADLQIYDNLNESLLTLADNFFRTNPSKHASAIVALLNALELYGQERAIFVDAIKRNSNERLADFEFARGSKLAQLETFLREADPKLAGQARRVLEGEAATTCSQLCKTTLSGSQAKSFNCSRSEWWAASTDRVDSMKEIEDLATQELRKGVGFVRANASSALWRQLLYILAITAIVATVAFTIRHGVTKQVASISDMLSMIGIGDFDARADVVTQDELGTVAMSLNSLCDNTLGLIQSAEERDQITQSIESLRREVTEIAAGDLSGGAEVAEDITGPISDSVNFMVAELRHIIDNVKTATLQVSSSASEIRSTTEHLSEESEVQSHKIHETSTAIGLMASSVAEVANKTAESAKVASQAREHASDGFSAVENTIEGMDRIRDRVQETSKRIKRLGESSQEIGEIVKLIGDIADRTSLLALNASIQAAMAGEAGQGFAVVADEVERLAERSNEATKQVGALIKSIQSETAEAITAMEESTREVVDGSNLAANAGKYLGEIDNVADQLATLIESISASTSDQAHSAEELSKSMLEISQVTDETSKGTKRAADFATQLVVMSDNLRGSVSRFKLPGRPEPTQTGLTTPIEAVPVQQPIPAQAT